MSNKKSRSVSYADAGVSIEHGNELVHKIKDHVNNTKRPGVMGNLGGFGALFDLSALNYNEPVLVSGTDGVGTKLKLAIESGKHDSIGIDLVAMCVNDLIVQGAEPLFFLDYYACSKLDVEIAADVVKGIAEGCKLAGCALVGGETAEMPGIYQTGDYDLAGFCVGIVEKANIIDGSQINTGDIMIGLQSSGPHSNGYSLIRKLLSDSGTSLTDNLDGNPMVDILLAPTKIYTKSVLSLLPKNKIKGISHITGGGLLENIPRILPEHVTAAINCDSWKWPPIFHWLQEQGNIEQNEMYKTFNCGVGLVLIVEPDSADYLINDLTNLGESAWIIGEIDKRTEGSKQVTLLNE